MYEYHKVTWCDALSMVFSVNKLQTYKKSKDELYVEHYTLLMYGLHLNAVIGKIQVRHL